MISIRSKIAWPFILSTACIPEVNIPSVSSNSEPPKEYGARPGPMAGTKDDGLQNPNEPEGQSGPTAPLDPLLPEDSLPPLEGNGWMPIPQAPPWCPTRVRLLPPAEDRWLRWVPCAGGGTGCSEVVWGSVQRQANIRSYLNWWQVLPPVFWKGKPYFQLRRSFFREGEGREGALPKVIESFVSLDGHVLAEAFIDEVPRPKLPNSPPHSVPPRLQLPNSPPNSYAFCDSEFGMAGARIVGAFQSGFRDLDSYESFPGTTRDIFWSASIDDPSSASSKVQSPRAFGVKGPDQVSIQGNVAYVQVGLGGRKATTTSFQVTNGDLLMASGSPGFGATFSGPYPSPGNAPGVYVRGYLEGDPPASRSGWLYFLRPDGQAELLADTLAGRAVGQVRTDLAADGTPQALVWLDLYRPNGGLGSDIKLMTSPMAYSRSQMAPRCVANVTPEGAYFTMAHRGLVGLTLIGYGNNSDSVRLLRLSDGASWNLPSRKDFRFAHILWADDTYVWAIATTNVESPASPRKMTNALVRLERSTLGPPTPGQPCTPPIVARENRP